MNVIDQAHGESWASWCITPFGSLQTTEWCGKIRAWQHARTAQPTSSLTEEIQGDSARWPARLHGSDSRSQLPESGSIRSTWLRGWERRTSLALSTATRSAFGSGCETRGFRLARVAPMRRSCSSQASLRNGQGRNTHRKLALACGRSRWLTGGCPSIPKWDRRCEVSAAPRRRIGRAASRLNVRPSTRPQSGPMPSRQFGTAMAVSAVDARLIRQLSATGAALSTSTTSSASTRVRS